jgi:hypothetical protein
MNRRFSDWKWAFLTALGLTGTAALLLFLIRPGGFDSQVGWFFALLPGSIAGAPRFRIALTEVFLGPIRSCSGH